MENLYRVKVSSSKTEDFKVFYVKTYASKRLVSDTLYDHNRRSYSITITRLEDSSNNLLETPVTFNDAVKIIDNTVLYIRKKSASIETSGDPERIYDFKSYFGKDVHIGYINSVYNGFVYTFIYINPPTNKLFKLDRLISHFENTTNRHSLHIAHNGNLFLHGHYTVIDSVLYELNSYVQYNESLIEVK